MRRVRPAVLSAVAVGALSLCAAAQARHFSGVIPDIPSGGRVHAQARAHAANLPYGGGRVMHSNRTHLIFWAPAGSGLGFEDRYLSLIKDFMANVAADSHRSTNVYSLSGQYSDAGGPAAYNSSYGGAILDTDGLPNNGCNEPVLSGPGWSRCMNDGQIQSEIARVIAEHHLPTGIHEIYFMVTPNGLGSCFGSGPTSCALGGPNANRGYCGYHANTPDNRILYAVIPFTAVAGHCQSGNPRPNGSAADPTISDISHEHNETVTDPFGDAWIDANGLENGDLCISSFGAVLGGSGNAIYNQVIHGGHYYLQQEWSNNDGGCAAQDEAASVSLLSSARAVRGRPVTFSATAGDPDGAIVSYDWFFGPGSGHHQRLTHTFKRAGLHRIVLRVVDSSGNFAFASRTIRVG